MERDLEKVCELDAVSVNVPVLESEALADIELDSEQDNEPVNVSVKD